MHHCLLVETLTACPGMNWLDGSLINSYVSAPLHEQLIEIANDLYLHQIIQVPTRGLNNIILDLCFTTHPDKIETFPGLSDHCAILISFSHNIQSSRQNPEKIFLFDRANWDVSLIDFFAVKIFSYIRGNTKIILLKYFYVK